MSFIVLLWYMCLVRSTSSIALLAGLRAFWVKLVILGKHIYLQV